MKYLSYLLYPLCIAGAGYSLLNVKYKRWVLGSVSTALVLPVPSRDPALPRASHRERRLGSLACWA